MVKIKMTLSFLSLLSLFSVFVVFVVLFVVTNFPKLRKTGEIVKVC